MSSPQHGEVIEVVLDVVRVEREDGSFERVIVRGVYPRGGPYPPLEPGAARNVVQTFYGATLNVRAFLLPAAPDVPAGEDAEDG